MGSSIISIFSKATNNNNSTDETASTNIHNILRRDALIVVFITFFGLLLAAILGNACVHILNDFGYFYLPGSFGNNFVIIIIIINIM